jgi:hypothetical protein
MHATKLNELFGDPLQFDVHARRTSSGVWRRVAAPLSAGRSGSMDTQAPPAFTTLTWPTINAAPRSMPIATGTPRPTPRARRCWGSQHQRERANDGTRRLAICKKIRRSSPAASRGCRRGHGDRGVLWRSHPAEACPEIRWRRGLRRAQGPRRDLARRIWTAERRRRGAAAPGRKSAFSPKAG